MNVDTTEGSKLTNRIFIDQGAFGEVYKADHVSWGPVAYKKLNSHLIKENSRYEILVTGTCNYCMMFNCSIIACNTV